MHLYSIQHYSNAIEKDLEPRIAQRCVHSKSKVLIKSLILSKVSAVYNLMYSAIGTFILYFKHQISVGRHWPCFFIYDHLKFVNW